MKIIFGVALCLVFTDVLAGPLIHPLDFKGSDQEKERVVNYIKDNVKQTLTAIGAADPVTLRMMEKEQLRAFKELRHVEDRALLDSVIASSCGIGVCDYSTILMMYTEQQKAKGDQLVW